jgi:membrane-associated protein
MQTLMSFVDIFLHVDKHLEALVAGYGIWVYAILFLIIFCETGLVVTAILPGDSLLFAAGSLCALGDTSESRLSIFVVIPLLIVAAIIGDAVNYSIGKALGPGYLEKKDFRFIKKQHLERTQKFYEAPSRRSSRASGRCRTRGSSPSTWWVRSPGSSSASSPASPSARCRS